MMFPVVRTNGRNLSPAFEPWTHLNREMGRVLGEPTCGTMPVDIREEGEGLLIAADVPGATQDQINVTVENGLLTIAVNRQGEQDSNGHNWFVRERHSGNVSRTFRLPESADLNNVEANLSNGVLTLRVPKKEEAKPRQIQVK